MPLVLFVAFIVVPLVELWVISQVGGLIGLPLTILLLVVDSLFGAWLVRREGRRAWDALRTAFSSGQWPADEMTQGALVIFGGALLLTPGFVTDAVGLLAVLPPTRAMMSSLLRRWSGTWAARRGGAGSVFMGGAGAPRQGSGGSGGGPDGRGPSVGSAGPRRRPANAPRGGDSAPPGEGTAGADTPDVEVISVERDADEA